MNKKLRRQRRRELNGKMFPSELWFMKELNVRGIYRCFERNFPLLNMFFGDFVFQRLRLVVEIDGSSHEGKADYDDWRDKKLTAAGFTVVRIKYPKDKEQVLEFFRKYEKQLRIQEKRIAKRNKRRDPQLTSEGAFEELSARQKMQRIAKERNKAAIEALEHRRKVKKAGKTSGIQILKERETMNRVQLALLGVEEKIAKRRAANAKASVLD